MAVDYQGETREQYTQRVGKYLASKYLRDIDMGGDLLAVTEASGFGPLTKAGANRIYAEGPETVHWIDVLVTVLNALDPGENPSFWEQAHDKETMWFLPGVPVPVDKGFPGAVEHTIEHPVAKTIEARNEDAVVPEEDLAELTLVAQDIYTLFVEELWRDDMPVVPNAYYSDDTVTSQQVADRFARQLRGECGEVQERLAGAITRYFENGLDRGPWSIPEKPDEDDLEGWFDSLAN